MKLYSGNNQETFRLTQSIDWTHHPLGTPEQWDPLLINFLNYIFNSHQPCFLFWSEEAYCFYNDGYIAILGNEKHPKSMGAKAIDIWQEIWTNYTYPQFAKAMSGEPTWNIDHFIPISRNNEIVEAYFTYGYSPLFGDNGKIKGVLTTAVETTDKVMAVNALQENQDKLNVALDVTKLGYFDWDIVTSKITYNNRFKEDWGLSSHDSAEKVESRIHPEDAKRVAEDVRKAIEDNAPYENSYRILHPEKGVIWIEAKGIVRFKDNKAIRFFGTSLNVTTEHNAVAEIEKAQKDLYQFFMQAPSPMTIIMGDELRFFMANPPYAKMVGRDVVGKTVKEAFGDAKIGHFVRLLVDVYKNGVVHEGREMELSIPDQDGIVKERLLNVSYHPFREVDGTVKGVLCFHQDVTDQVRSRKRIEEYARELQSSVQSRDEFLSIASHELKTPVTSLKLQLQMVKRRLPQNGSNNKLEDGINLSLKQIDRLTELIENLLDVAKIQSGKMNFDFHEVNVKALMEEVIERLHDSALMTHSPIRLDAPENLIAKWDRSRMDQVMINLLTNAIKYAPGKPILVKVTSTVREIQISVADSGPGIMPEQLDKMFERFERVGASRNISGLGLGLFIVKQIVQGHDGDIKVQSELGKGTEFCIRIPKRDF